MLMKFMTEVSNSAFESVPVSYSSDSDYTMNGAGTLSIDQMAVLGSMLADYSSACPHVVDAGISFGTDMTTLMMRNIPKRCTQRMLMSDVVMTGFGNCVDFVYLPTDISSGRNLGYAFLNFVKPEHAESFRNSFHKKHLSMIRGSRAGLSVGYAIIQGFQANLDNVLKTASVHRIRNPEYMPLILDSQGRLVPCMLVAPAPSSRCLFKPSANTLSAH